MNSISSSLRLVQRLAITIFVICHTIIESAQYQETDGNQLPTADQLDSGTKNQPRLAINAHYEGEESPIESPSELTNTGANKTAVPPSLLSSNYDRTHHEAEIDDDESRSAHPNIQQTEEVEHQKDETPITASVCVDMCPYCHKMQSHLVNHVNIVHKKIKRFACSDCSYVSYRRTSVQAHIDNMHRCPSNAEVVDIRHANEKFALKNNGKIQCSQCETICRPENLNNHISAHHNNLIKCKWCCRSYNEKNMQKHMQVHHKDKTHVVRPVVPSLTHSSTSTEPTTISIPEEPNLVINNAYFMEVSSSGYNGASFPAQNQLHAALVPHTTFQGDTAAHITTMPQTIIALAPVMPFSADPIQLLPQTPVQTGDVAAHYDSSGDWQPLAQSVQNVPNQITNLQAILEPHTTFHGETAAHITTMPQTTLTLAHITPSSADPIQLLPQTPVETEDVAAHYDSSGDF